MGLYVHVPFCRTKCHYCAFLSQTDMEPAFAWANAVGIEATQAEAHGPLQTLYVGGGTPTALSIPVLEQTLQRLLAWFPYTDDVEITVEANPDDVTPELLRSLRYNGVTRVSLGVQSFRDDELRFLGRRHNAQQAQEAIAAARAEGFSALSLDLMYGFRGQRLDQWQESLHEACAWQPEHLSCYQLAIEPGTLLGRRVARGLLARVPESKEHAFYMKTAQYLTSRGYEHYEVSNFAQPGYRSRHNSLYWRRAPYLGFGPGAHSFDGRMRWWNVASVAEYVRLAEQGGSPRAGGEALTEEQSHLERLMLGFRTTDGVTLETIRQCVGWEQTLERLHDGGFVYLTGDRIVPTVRGMAVADRLPLEFSA